MMSILRKGMRFFETPYTITKNKMATNNFGEHSIEEVTTFVIYANIQNVTDGEQIEMGRDDSLAYHSIIIITRERIGLGDPVYDGEGTPYTYLIGCYGRTYRIMMEGGVQPSPVIGNDNRQVYYRYHAELDRVNGNR